MFKKLLLVFWLLLLLVQAYALAYIVEPVDKAIPNGSEAAFGKIARGETLKVVVKKKSGLGFEWDSISVDPGFLPPGWGVEIVDTDKTMLAMVSLSKNAEVSTQRLKFTLSSSSQPMLSETFYGTLSVNESLLEASIENLNNSTVLGQPASFSLVLNNDSIAEHAVAIESGLPGYWFMPVVTTLKPFETKAIALEVFPYSYGEKNFSFRVYSKTNMASFPFQARLNVKPTLSGMFRASIAGFPFFSPGLLTQYLLNGFLSLVT